MHSLWDIKKRKFNYFSLFLRVFWFIYFYELAGSPFSIFIISVQESYKVILNIKIWPYVHKFAASKVGFKTVPVLQRLGSLQLSREDVTLFLVAILEKNRMPANSKGPSLFSATAREWIQWQPWVGGLPVALLTSWWAQPHPDQHHPWPCGAWVHHWGPRGMDRVPYTGAGLQCCWARAMESDCSGANPGVRYSFPL